MSHRHYRYVLDDEGRPVEIDVRGYIREWWRVSCCRIAPPQKFRATPSRLSPRGTPRAIKGSFVGSYDEVYYRLLMEGCIRTEVKEAGRQRLERWWKP
jgi:hypothetical protein